MGDLLQILPGTGRVTMRSMVEGSLSTRIAFHAASGPSVSTACCHLPVPGRI